MFASFNQTKVNNNINSHINMTTETRTNMDIIHSLVCLWKILCIMRILHSTKMSYYMWAYQIQLNTFYVENIFLIEERNFWIIVLMQVLNYIKHIHNMLFSMFTWIWFNEFFILTILWQPLYLVAWFIPIFKFQTTLNIYRGLHLVVFSWVWNVDDGTKHDQAIDHEKMFNKFACSIFIHEYTKNITLFDYKPNVFFRIFRYA